MNEHKNYKIAVMSDSHGKRGNIENVLPEINGCNYFVYLGDGNGDIDKIGDKITAKIIRVRGNCDAVSDLPAETVLKVGETDFLITHGNLYGVKRGLLSLALRARELACAYALYGHTHTASAQQSQGVTLINPGAMSGFSPSYALIEGDGILFHVDFFTPQGGEKNVKK